MQAGQSVLSRYPTRHTISAFRSFYAASKRAQAFEDVIHDLSTRSSDFNRMWNGHDVKKVDLGSKTIIDIHGQVNAFTYTSLKADSAPGCTRFFSKRIFVYRTKSYHF